MAAIRGLIAQAAQRGARFRFSGATVEIDGLEALPPQLQASLVRHQVSGQLYDYMGGDVLDGPAVAFVGKLDVSRMLIETPADARMAVRTLIRDLKKYQGGLAIDTETAPKPGYADPHTYIKLKGDGGLDARPAQHKGVA